MNLDSMPIGSVSAYMGCLSEEPFLKGVTPSKNARNAKNSLDLLSYGWVYCNGQSLNKGEFNQLYRLIGDTFGSDKNDFHVPDLRGYFLRAVDDGAGLDTGSRKTAVGGKKNDVGSTEEDNFQAHEHTYQGGQSAAAVPAESGADAVMIQTLNTSAIVSHQSMGEPRYGKETRPINMAVNYIIKARSICCNKW